MLPKFQALDSVSLFIPLQNPEVVMPRIPRLLVSELPTVYHVVSRTALPGLPFDASDKDRLQWLIHHFSRIYFTEILGFCLMDNHFHLLVRMFPENHADESSLRERFKLAYGDKAVLSPEKIPDLRLKWSSLSEFVKEIKQSFSRYYNKKNGRRGYLWGDRFKSVIVQDGRTLVNCLAYIDLNPVRANIVKRPEDYRWSSLGYHLQTRNRGGFLSLDLGMAEWGVKPGERLQKYREFVYETGALDTGKGARLDPALVKKERSKGYKLTTADRFRCRTRYFTDSGIIGTREFVARNSKRFHDYFACKHEKIPRKVEGLEGMFSLKRLSNA
jgi:REP element-mobilizing transposase RayT